MLKHSDLAEIAATVYRPAWSNTVAGDVHAALLPRDGEVVVALPGTHPDDALDWLRDARFLPTRVRGIGLVHEGFGLGARAEWVRIAPILSTDKLITFTGHSLGGSLALCLAGILAYERPGARFRVVVFAPARVAFLNPWFHRLLAAGVEAVIYAVPGDIVPGLPFWPWYTHGARTTHIGVNRLDELENHAVAQFAPMLRARGL